MRRRTAILVAAIIVITVAYQVSPSDSDSGIVTAAPARQQPGERQRFMRQKLSMVNKIVEGLATEDFDMVARGGKELAELAESAMWVSDRDPYYGHYSSNFQQAVRGLIDAANSESASKVTFAYVHVTFSCTACHQHVRNVARLAQ